MIFFAIWIHHIAHRTQAARDPRGMCLLGRSTSSECKVSAFTVKLLESTRSLWTCTHVQTHIRRWIFVRYHIPAAARTRRKQSRHGCRTQLHVISIGLNTDHALFNTRWCMNIRQFTYRPSGSTSISCKEGAILRNTRVIIFFIEFDTFAMQYACYCDISVATAHITCNVTIHDIHLRTWAPHTLVMSRCIIHRTLTVSKTGSMTRAWRCTLSNRLTYDISQGSRLVRSEATSEPHRFPLPLNQSNSNYGHNGVTTQFVRIQK